jgi:hypothetical protein
VWPIGNGHAPPNPAERRRYDETAGGAAPATIKDLAVRRRAAVGREEARRCAARAWLRHVVA